MMYKPIYQFTVITIVFILLLSLLSIHFPFSLFFNLFHSQDVLFQQVDKSNSDRTDISNKYFSSLNSATSLAFYEARLKKKLLKVAIGIISIKRMSFDGKSKSYGYLLQSAASIDSMLKEKPVLNDSICFICNVHIHASQHKDATRLYSYMPYVERYGENSLGITDIFVPRSDRRFKDITQHHSLYQKETYDYAFCLQAAAKLNPDFILLIEEDTIPHPDFPDFLDHMFNFRFKGENMNKFGFVKFYYPKRWQGFGFGFVELIDLISFSVFVAALISVISFCFSSKYVFNNQKRHFLTGFIISLISCYIIGRQNLNDFRRFSYYLYRMKQSDPCCTQAVLYPKQIAKNLSFFLISESMSTHTDLILWDYISENELSVYQFEPNLFYHTGLYSSLPLQQKDPIEFIIP